jgi:hypothetical protein
VLAVSVGTAPPGGNIEPLTHVACDLAGGGTTVHIANAVRSGVQESIIYKGQFGLRYSLEDVFTNNVVDTEWSWAELGY